MIGLGQSPTPIISFLQQAQGEHSAINLPLSGFKPSMPSSTGERAEGLSEGEVRTLFKHFDRFIPTASALGDADIVLVDYASTGWSLLSAAEYLDLYLKSSGRKNKVVVVPLGPKDNLEAVKTNAASRGIVVQPIELASGGPLRKAFVDANYDKLSEYGEFDLAFQKSADLKSRAVYKQFGKEMASHISADPSAIARLSALGTPKNFPPPPRSSGGGCPVWSEKILNYFQATAGAF